MDLMNFDANELRAILESSTNLDPKRIADFLELLGASEGSVNLYELLAKLVTGKRY